MARRYYSTTAQRTTLASSCTDSATTIVVTAATGFPSSTPFPLVLDADTVNEEAVLVTSRVGTTCTVTRAYDGTTGVAHSAGATVRHTALALDFNEASEHVFEAATAHGLTLADVITTDNTKTLTNKTLTAPTIADFTNAAHDHGDADDGGTLPASSVLNRPLNDQSGTGGSAYTFALADARKHVLASGGSTKTFTIPLQAAVTWLADAKIIVTNTGAGVLTIAITATGTLNGSDLTLAQGESAALLRTASDVWWCLPFSSGSAVPRGTISGTTGSPATSANGGATAYKWPSDGTVTVDVAGLFSALVVAGGGGGGTGTGGADYAGGGGGGQVLALTDIYLAAGTYTVNVGAGGAAGDNGEASWLGSFYAVGGGAGSPSTSASKNGKQGGNGGGGGGAPGGATGGAGVMYAGGAGGGNSNYTSGGGGGASAAGTAGGATNSGAGGAGLSNSITGSAVTYAGGGGGGAPFAGGGSAGTGGTGGGGAGGNNTTGTAGTANTGGGGGGGGGTSGSAGGAGGSGVVILLVGTV